MLSSASHVFLTGKLAEDGILQQYLADSCDSKPNKLCSYINEIPNVGYLYVWDPNGAFQKIGAWDSSGATHKPIIHDIFTTPHYIAMFAQKSVEHTVQQLRFITTPVDEQAQDVESSPFKTINAHIKSEIPQFRKARQQAGTLNNRLWIYLQLLVLTISTPWAIYLVLSGRIARKKMLYIYVAIVAFVICNAFVTASFANVLDRLQNRVFWVFPASNIIVLCQYYLDRKKNVGQ